VLCRERRGHQGQTLTGRVAGLAPRAFLPAINTHGRGTETPLGACSGNTQQKQNQSLVVAGLYRTTPCKSCKNDLEIVFAAFCHQRVGLRGFALSSGPWGHFLGHPAMPSCRSIPQPEIHMLHVDYLQEKQQQRAVREAEEQMAREREQQEQRDRVERERQHEEQEKQKAQEMEGQREEERRLARESERVRRGMGMGR